MQPYLTVPFKLSTAAWNWLQDFLEPIAIDFQLNAPSVTALITLKENDIANLQQSIAWTEIVNFMTGHGIAIIQAQLFIYKTLPQARSVILGNPHIDTAGANGTELTVPFRFNILARGDEQTEMVWWEHDRTSSSVVESTFIRPDGTPIGRLQARGATLLEQWATVGEPTVRCSTLAKQQEYASFVRTDILHALNWTGENPRVVVSIKCIDASWEDLLQHNSIF